jgi:hypothetical protein
VARPEVSDLTACLLGTWRLDREILDGSRRAITGRFSGHDLDLRDGVWEVEHRCGDDRYVGLFEVDDTHRWRHQWTVDGPRKCHLIRTLLERPTVQEAAAGPGGCSGRAKPVARRAAARLPRVASRFPV